MVYNGYVTISAIKVRCLIDISETTFDTQLEYAGEEASRHVDEIIRPYMTYAQNVTLTEADYVDCVTEDIGYKVLDDEVEAGELLDYNNTTRVWKIRTMSSIANGSTLILTGGTGEGISSASTNAVSEASLPVFVFNSLPLSAVIPDQLKEAVADFGAGIYLRRYMPDTYSDVWAEEGRIKMDDFIKANFISGKVIFIKG